MGTEQVSVLTIDTKRRIWESGVCPASYGWNTPARFIMCSIAGIGVRTSKGDAGKVKLARQLRAETTMTLRWIAKRLQMGSWTYVSNLLREKN